MTSILAQVWWNVAAVLLNYLTKTKSFHIFRLKLCGVVTHTPLGNKSLGLPAPRPSPLPPSSINKATGWRGRRGGRYIRGGDAHALGGGYGAYVIRGRSIVFLSIKTAKPSASTSKPEEGSTCVSLSVCNFFPQFCENEVALLENCVFGSLRRLKQKIWLTKLVYFWGQCLSPSLVGATTHPKELSRRHGSRGM